MPGKTSGFPILHISASLQIAMSSSCLFALALLVWTTDSKPTNATVGGNNNNDIGALGSPQKLLDPSQIPLPPASRLLDLDDFAYLHTPSQPVCSEVFFLVLVQSSPAHFERRRIIRETWGSVRDVGGGKTIRLAFLMGRPRDPEKGPRAIDGGGGRGNKQMPEVQSKIDAEAAQHGDLIQGNFLDSRSNTSSHKHLMGNKWIVDNCLDAVLVVRTDDDVFVEIFHLSEFVSAIYGGRPQPGSLICDVIPSGTAPRRSGEWEVGNTVFPDYCSGLAYLMTPDLAGSFLKASTKVRRLKFGRNCL